MWTEIVRRLACRAHIAALVGLMAAAPAARADAADVQRLIAAYPEQLSHVEGNDLVWRDGTRMTIDDGRRGKSREQLLNAPDLKDMFYLPYPVGRAGVPPAMAPGQIHDPGRVRHAAYFAKMYGDCDSGHAARNLVEVVWLAKTAPQKLKVTRINGVAQRLQAVSDELETLPAILRGFLTPSAGTYVCRPIAGTGLASAHGWGIAIDIAVAQSNYWRWDSHKPSAAIAWRNRIPMEIVEIFEKHGFIWGGKWYHYDTMHFEYRPELLPPRP